MVGPAPIETKLPTRAAGRALLRITRTVRVVRLRMDIAVLLAFCAFAVGYLAGSIPFGVIITRLAGATDPRAVGSRNIGATNVLRTGRKDLAALTLLADALKGTVAVLVFVRIGDGGLPVALIAAAGAFLGHLFPVFLGFKGGKGVATFLGCLFGVAWPAGLVFVAFWLVSAKVTRYSSAAALLASALSPVALLCLGRQEAAALFALLAAGLWIKHRTNIERLLHGTESRIGESERDDLGGRQTA